MRRSHPNTTLSEPKPVPKYKSYLTSYLLSICNWFISLCSGFWEWMYPPMAGEENVEMAALGVLILWFSWHVAITIVFVLYSLI